MTFTTVKLIRSSNPTGLNINLLQKLTNLIFAKIISSYKVINRYDRSKRKVELYEEKVQKLRRVYILNCAFYGDFQKKKSDYDIMRL